MNFEFRIDESMDLFSRNFSCFLLQQYRIFLLRPKMLLKLLIFTRHFAALLKENKTFFVKKKSWIHRFGIPENISRTKSRSSHRTPNFTNSEFQFPQFKVLQSAFLFFFNITG